MPDAPTTDPSAEARPISGALIALCLLCGLGATFLLPRVHASAGLQMAFGGAIFLLAGWVGLLRLARKPLGVQIWLRKPHYIQGAVQGGVYVYWAFYWPQVSAQLPLIAAQILFLMLFEACISWTQGRQYRLGFSAAPIIGSLNLFLWFRDEAFVWQLVVVAAAYLSKEFIKWNRAGPDGVVRRVHIFNPSAIVLALAGLTMIITQTAHLSWAAEISTALGRPPFAYGNIFLMGLIVLSFVPSVLITLSATLTFMALGAGFFWVTGAYRFVDTTIPIAVWLGLTLLATDPASTPRRGLGKVIFGVLYAASVFVIYGVLRGLERPPTPGDPGLHVSYFDKLLFLPVLNLSARWIDALARWLTPRLERIYPRSFTNPKVHLIIWIGVFLWVRPGLVDHPARSVAFLESTCDASGPGSLACDQLLDRYRHDCVTLAVAAACFNAGVMLEPSPAEAASMYARGCVAGMGSACLQTARLARSPDEQREAATRGCALGEEAACQGLSALGLADLKAGAFPRAASVLGPACQGKGGQACALLSELHARGQGVPRDAARAEALRSQACALGFQPACAGRRPR